MVSEMFQPRRRLGQTGFRATILGIGDVADRKVPMDTCVATVRRALDVGLNVIDTAPAYEDGFSEEIVGAALKGRRDGIFVIDKIDHFDKAVEPQIEGSLRRLGMESTDAFVFHGVSRLEDWRRLTSPGGPADQLARAVEAGKTRFKGISSHHPDVLKAAIEAGFCDVVLFPIGPYVDERYVMEILPLARRRKIGTVCFKTFGAGKLLGATAGYGEAVKARPRGKVSSGGESSTSEPHHLTPEECVRYTLTCDPDVALLGMSFPNEQDPAFRAALDFEPLDAAGMTEVRRRATEAIRGKGKCWWNP